jgi:hypothetical protein
MKLFKINYSHERKLIIRFKLQIRKIIYVFINGLLIECVCIANILIKQDFFNYNFVDIKS